MTANESQHLWAEFGDSLRRFIVRRVASEADAEDILQDVFLRFHQRRDTVRHADRLGAWLFQITRNAIIDYYRAPVRRRELAAGSSLELTAGQHGLTDHESELDGDPGQAQAELASCLRPMIAQLPAHYREAVALVDLAGLTQRAAAEQLGLSVSGMKSRVQRGRRGLRAILQECCRVHLDATGRVMDYESRAGSCAGSGDECQCMAGVALDRAM